MLRPKMVRDGPVDKVASCTRSDSGAVALSRPMTVGLRDDLWYSIPER